MQMSHDINRPSSLSLALNPSLTFEPHTEPSANTTVTPTFAVEPVSITTALEGSRAVLECSGHGYPQPTESWSMSQSRIFPLFEHVEPTGELVVDPVTPEHAGNYTCRIRDHKDTIIAERHVELIVRGERAVL